MIPLYKLFVVTARLFAKPIITLIKKRHKSSKELSKSLFSRFFIALGNREHKMDLWMNRKLLSINDDTEMFVKPLNNEVALEKGLEFFYECLVYFLIIAVSVWEIRRTSADSKAQRERDLAEVELLKKRIEQLEASAAGFGNLLLGVEKKMELIIARLEEKPKEILESQKQKNEIEGKNV